MEANGYTILDFPKHKFDVIQMADAIRKITKDKQLRGYADLYALDKLDKISSVANSIIQKEYQKVIMPKVFDVWYWKQSKTSLLVPKMELIFSLSSLILSDSNEKDYEVALREWIFEGNHFDYAAYEKCVDAINNGFKVEGEKHE
ncbi:hypothetical protein [Companilactobacillus nantensis]|uniref:Uncharacterized protein n=1 Tax=Companilactobacillus nantensis DSM 16982 TaxID=1423774 RepID=A0A0R1WL08_9LACO|nr:hypothetical protein [Companilactobacillus nantensis]KRM18447.1 hypothetical protein FD31_GL000994 [Companilactobacillus nantensis DSM 16982]GEO63017.1 hypothetical protein LNA01_02000 [Companilactobacillus nantensis]